MRGLDTLRGLLAVYVLAGHARWLLWCGHSQWIQEYHFSWANLLAYSSATLRFGHEAVLVFFVLSGFFIHLRAAKAIASHGTIDFRIREYGWRRLHRLAPPYIAALVLTAALDALGKHRWPMLYQGLTGDILLDYTFLNSGYSYASIISAVCFLPGSFGESFGSNAPLWSLSYEVIFYAVYPAWVSVRQLTGLVPASLMAIAVSMIAAKTPSLGFLGGVAAHWYLWVAGAVLADCLCSSKAMIRKNKGSLLVSLVVLMSLALAEEFYRMIIAGCTGIGVVLLFGWLSMKWKDSALFRLFEWLGIRSYTIYICHFPILTFFCAWAYSYWGSRPCTGYLSVVGGIGALAATLVYFELCEKHFLHLRLEQH